jgi:hypothetical protein
MKFNKSNALGYIQGCRAMLEVFIMASHDRTSFRKTLREVCEWHDKTLLPWKQEIENSYKRERWESLHFLPPYSSKKVNRRGKKRQ